MAVYSGTVGSAGGNYEGTYEGHGPEYWTDINPNSFFKDPNVLVPAAEITRYKEDQDVWDLFRRPREVIYTEVHNNITFKYRLSLTFFVAPAGSTELVFGGTPSGTAGTVGRCIRNDATLLCTAAETHNTAAGFSLGKYFSVGVDTFGEAAVGPYAHTSLATDAFVVTSLTSGDGIWLVRSGRVVVDCSEAVSVGSVLTFAAAGEVAVATIHATATTLAEITDAAGNAFIGTALSSGTTALYAIADIHMPERYGDDDEGSGIPDASPQT